MVHEKSHQSQKKGLEVLILPISSQVYTSASNVIISQMLKTNIADMRCMSLRGKLGILLNEAYRLIEEVIVGGKRTPSLHSILPLNNQ